MKKTILTERFQQLAGLKPLYTLNEAINKPMTEFATDIEKRLKEAGFETARFKGQVVPQKDKIAESDKLLAGIAYDKMEKEGKTYEYLEICVRNTNLKKLKKITSLFSTSEGQYGPDKDIGWYIANVKNTNEGDIIQMGPDRRGQLAEVKYFKDMGAEKTFSGKTRKTDKATGNVTSKPFNK